MNVNELKKVLKKRRAELVRQYMAEDGSGKSKRLIAVKRNILKRDACIVSLLLELAVNVDGDYVINDDDSYTAVDFICKSRRKTK